MGKEVTVIKANRHIANTKVKEQEKIRVAAYCRVSTEQDEQLNSFENQVSYYTEYINNKPEFIMVDIYADEGITGTNTKKREGFNRMIRDCEDGKIDLIITKSISRFARNTQDCLEYSRKLKNMGIGILFEKENISTLDSTGELLFTILSSLAQDESRNISENCKWGIRSKFQKGIPHINTHSFMGFDKNEEGRLIINKEQAKVVKRIFREFLEGFNPEDIARRLNEDGIPGVSGEPKWIRATIIGMLKNEKYKGDALLQKYYTVDYLSKRLAVNDGEVDQYYVKNSHPAIISEDEWEAVQLEFERRQIYCDEHGIKCYGYRADRNPLVSKVICTKCGQVRGRKSWADRGVAYWHCKTKGCNGINVKDEQVQKAIMIAWNSVVQNRNELLEKWNAMQEEDSPLVRLRAKQMIELTAEGPITKPVPELIQMVLEKVETKAPLEFTIYFLDGTIKEIIL